MASVLAQVKAAQARLTAVPQALELAVNAERGNPSTPTEIAEELAKLTPGAKTVEAAEAAKIQPKVLAMLRKDLTAAEDKLALTEEKLVLAVRRQAAEKLALELGQASEPTTAGAKLWGGFGSEPDATAREIARLQAENQRLKASHGQGGALTFRVSAKGAVSVYGMGRFPVTLYQEQWTKLAAAMPQLVAFLEQHKGELSSKGAVKA